MPTVAGIFSDRDTTERGLSDLYEHGFDSDQIGVIWRDRSYSEPVEEYEYRERHYADEHAGPAEEAGKGAAGGAVGGAAVGAGTVLLASAGLALIPGIGALLAAGTAAATLAGAAAGAVGGGVTGGVVGALVGAGDEDDEVTEEQTRYRQAIGGEGFVLTVETDNPGEAADALRDAGAGDVTVIEEAEYYG